MSNIASLTYEVLLAYILPGAIVQLSYLVFIQKLWNLQWDLSSPSFLLGFLGLSVAVGFLIDSLGHVLMNEWQRSRRNLVWFGKPTSRSVLFHYMQTLYPSRNEKDVEDLETKVELIYAIFNSHVSEHVYARRNWEWTFHEASRNLLISSPLTTIGFMLSGRTWSVFLTVLISVSLIDYFILYKYMKWSLSTYYGYYASVVLGKLLEKSSESPSAVQSLVDKNG